jgi:hypothetical protein
LLRFSRWAPNKPSLQIIDLRRFQLSLRLTCSVPIC